MIKLDKTYRIISEGSQEEKLRLLAELPENNMKESAKSLMFSTNPTAILLAYGSMLPSYCHGANCAIGEVLAFSLYKYGKELFLSGDYPDLFLMTVIGYANNYINALINLSTFQVANDFINAELPFWQKYEKNIESLHSTDQIGFINNLKSILVAKINILIQLNYIDDAWDLAFNSNDRAKGNWSSDIELNRLKNILMQIKRGVSELDKTAEQRKIDLTKNQKSSTENMFESLKSMFDEVGMDSNMIDSLKLNSKIDPYSQSGFEKLEDILTIGESFLQKDSTEVNEISVRQKVRRASGIFVDNQPTQEEILNSLKILKQSLHEAIQLENNILINDAYFGLYLCYSRLNKYSEAANQLILLRQNLELVRKGISDPMERGGVFQTYPYLFYSMVEYLYKAKRFNEMFYAIEGSKGRAIVDTLEIESGLNITDFSILNDRDKIQPILAENNAHYVSYHVDDDCSYVSIITKKGGIFSDKILIGKESLNKWYNKSLHQPLKWYSQFIKVDIIRELNPFVSLLQILIKKGEIEKGDHICYSADHLLYLYPLHYLKIENKYLIELNTISRVHNASHLIYLFSRPAVKPKNCLTVDVPSVDETKRPKRINEFSKSSLVLKKLFSDDCSHLYHEDAYLDEVIMECDKKQLIHFSTHGFFPLSDNPYDNSGLLIADGGQLPKLYINDPNYPYKKEGKHLLSPKRLLSYNKLQFDNAHISMQSCVGGHAREGIGGDALGLEWAFFQKGAGSLISTFWNVDTVNATNFFCFFYENWIIKGMSKAIAHQKALLKLKEYKSPDDIPDEFFWAGFGLIGDWR